MRQKYIGEILKLFELELHCLTRVGRPEKMKMRKKIVNVVTPALMVPDQTVRVFMGQVEENIADVLDTFIDPYGFRKKLARRVDQKLKQSAK
jgi:hypothetical protein